MPLLVAALAIYDGGLGMVKHLAWPPLEGEWRAAVKGPGELYLNRWPEKSLTRYTMASALRALLTLTGVSGHVIESFPWHLLTFETVTVLRTRIIEAEFALATANKLVAALQGVLATSWRMGLMSDECYRRIELKRIKGSRVVAGRQIEVDEVEDLLAELPSARDIALVAILYSCGLRRAEVVSLKKSDYRQGVFTVRGKGNKERLVPVPPEWREPIDAWVKGLPRDSYVFPGNGNGEAEHLTPAGVSYIVRKLREQYGREHFTTHDFRRSYASQLLDEGVDLVTVQHLMGHANANQTAAYDRRGEKAKVEAVKKLHRGK